MKNWDALETAKRIADRQVSALEVVQAAIDRIEADNPRLNAVVHRQYDQALATASQADFTGKPFGGVPILLKDLGQEEEGQPSTNGSRLFTNYCAQQSDFLTQKFKDLGFIVLGRTNTPEFGFKNISDSQLHGAVNLPADTRRNAGGSSGGAAAAVAAGLVPLAGASDGGGSIRIPAAFNGLIGLKPSRGRVPVGPGSFRGWQGASSHFALTKTVRDTRELLTQLQTYQVASPFPLKKLAAEDLHAPFNRPLRIAFYLDNPFGTMAEQTQQAALHFIKNLQALGHELVELSDYPVNPRQLLSAYYLMNSVETAAMFDRIQAGMSRPLTEQDMEAMTWAIYRSGQGVPASVYSQTLQDWDRFAYQMHLFHESYDLLLTPTATDVAPKHSQLDPAPALFTASQSLSVTDWKGHQDMVWQLFAKSLELTPLTVPANLTGQPAISLPVKQTLSPLPIGMQLTAAKGREDLLIQLAEQLEAAGLL